MSAPTPGTPLPWQFEPHNGYGGSDPDGEPWPLGYISTVSPVAPIFELGTPLDFAHFEQDAHYIIHACNTFPALVEALEALVNAVMEGDDQDAFLIAKHSGTRALAKARTTSNESREM